MERKELIDLLRSKKYIDIEEIVIKDNGADPFVEFLNAYIHEIEDYKSFSLFQSKKLYEKCINREDVIWQSYYYYALHLFRNENTKDRNRAISLLKEGYKIFPTNDLMLMEILTHLSGKDLSKFVLANVDINVLTSTNKVVSFLSYYCFNNNCSELTAWLLDEQIIESYKNNEEYETSLIIGFLLYSSNQYKRAKDYFMHVESYSTNEARKYAALGNVLVSDEQDIEASIDALPMTYSVEPIVLEINGQSKYIVFESYLQLLWDDILKKEVIRNNKKLTAKIKGIRGYYKFETDDNAGITDLKSAIKFYENKDYYYALHMTYFYKGKFKETLKFGLEYFYLAPKEERAKGFCYIIIPEDQNEILELIELISSSSYRFYDTKVEFFEFMVVPVIEELHERGEHNLICEIVKSYDYDYVVKKAGFIVAYAFHDCNDLDIAKKYYGYINDEPSLVSAASLNNLANIHSSEGNFEQAIELRKKAFEKSGEDKDYEKRLNNEIKKNTDYLNMLKEENEATKDLMDENGWVLNILKNFYSNENDYGFVECPHKLLPKYLHLSKLKADEMIRYFIDKRYVRKVERSEHNIDTQASVYKVNRAVQKALLDLFQQEQFFGDITSCFAELTPNMLMELGYTERLLSKISSINDQSFQEMIKRDVRENIVAILTESYKSALVISGSVVEALMMYKLAENNIDRNKFPAKNGTEKTIRINEMSLAQLIITAEKHKVFTHEALKHSDAIRGYRNLIHPGVEVRKSKNTPIVTKDNVHLAWMVLKKVVSEI